jgi:hypothetical protein
VEVVHARRCGLDLHKTTVVASVLITADGGGADRLVQHVRHDDASQPATPLRHAQCA